MSTKGQWQRKHDKKSFDDSFDRIFGDKAGLTYCGNDAPGLLVDCVGVLLNGDPVAAGSRISLSDGDIIYGENVIHNGLIGARSGD